MSHTHKDSDNQKDLTHDDSLPDVNIKVRRFYLSHLSEDDQKSILITAETEKSTIDKRISLELEHPDHVELLQFNYKGPESDNYFPLNSTVNVKEIVLKKSITKITDSNLEDQQKYLIDDGIRLIITRKESDCRYLCEKAIEDEYTVVLQMKLEIIYTNNSFRRFAFYLDDDSGVLLCRAVRNKDMETIKVLLNLKLDINANNGAGWTPLHVAVDLKMTDVVDLLISNGADVNATNRQGRVPLHIAAKKSNLKILNSLFNNQAKLDEKDGNGQTPLHYAVSNGNKNVVDLFISKGADVNILNNYHQVPLHYAVGKNNLNILNSLLNNKAKLNEQDINNQTPLHYAVAAGNVNVVDILLKRGADYKLKDRWGHTPFHLAAKQINLDMIKVFLDNNADANTVNSRKQTPLHAIGETTLTNTSFGAKAADKQMYLKIINALLKKGANINFQDEEGNTPLHHAVMNKNSEFIQVLLECNADPAIKNDHGDNVLHFALTCIGGDNCVQDIFDSNVDINAVDEDGDTTLHLEIQRNYYNIVKLILKKNPNIDMKNKIGDTALHKAVKLKHYHMVDLLLINRANVDLKDSSEKTALHLAIESNEASIVLLLLKNNANVNLKDSSGRTALLLATKLPKISIEIIESILNSTDDIDAKDERGRTALHYVVLNNDDQTLEMLLKAKADINVKDSEGNTPLHLTTTWENGYALCFKCMRVLVNYQADVNAINNYMETPLHYACWNKNVGAVKYLIQNGADSSMRDRDGRTVFHYACMIKRGLYHEIRKAFRGLLNILVKEDISVNYVSKSGKTPLHYIVAEKYYRSFYFHERLLEIGADINIEDKNHITAIDIFLTQRYTFQYQKIKPFIEHVIKMKEMGMWVREKTLVKVYTVNALCNLEKILLYEHDCRKEVDLMNVNIDQSNITYYDFLKKSPHKAMNYTRNENVVNAIKSDELFAVFPIYGHFLKSHLRELQQRCNLYKKIQRFLKSNIFEWLPMDCMHEIFQYLNNFDLDNFLQALQPVGLIK